MDPSQCQGQAHQSDVPVPQLSHSQIDQMIADVGDDPQNSCQPEPSPQGQDVHQASQGEGQQQAHGQLEQLILCSICHDVMTQPRCLPCLHAFCELCLTRWSQSKARFFRRGRLGCPDCRAEHPLPPFQGVRGFPIEFRLQGIIDYIQRTSAAAAAAAAADEGETRASLKRVASDSMTVSSSKRLCTRAGGQDVDEGGATGDNCNIFNDDEDGASTSLAPAQPRSDVINAGLEGDAGTGSDAAACSPHNHTVTLSLPSAAGSSAQPPAVIEPGLPPQALAAHINASLLSFTVLLTDLFRHSNVSVGDMTVGQVINDVMRQVNSGASCITLTGIHSMYLPNLSTDAAAHAAAEGGEDSDDDDDDDDDAWETDWEEEEEEHEEEEHEVEEHEVEEHEVEEHEEEEHEEEEHEEEEHEEEEHEEEEEETENEGEDEGVEEGEGGTGEETDSDDEEGLYYVYSLFAPNDSGDMGDNE